MIGISTLEMNEEINNMRTPKESETLEKVVAFTFIFFLYGPVFLLIFDKLFIEISFLKQFWYLTIAVQLTVCLLCLNALKRLGVIKKLAQILGEKSSS